MTMPAPGKALPHEYIAAGWSTGEMARTDAGSYVEAVSPRVATVCAAGSIARSTNDDSDDAWKPLTLEFIREAKIEMAAHLRDNYPRHKDCTHGTLSGWNDCIKTTKSEVEEVLRVVAHNNQWAIRRDAHVEE